MSKDSLNKANTKNGKAVYAKSCMACHTLYGQGGKIGPELTGSNRSDLDYILLNIVDPNAEIAPSYKLTVIKTQNGRVISGNIKSENKDKVVVNVIGQEVILDKSQIISRDTSNQSMMPEGLLDSLSKQEVIDLIAYLQTKKDI